MERGVTVLVLGIETSCDETGIALYDDQRGLLSEQIHSQVGTHAEYGGVVPELASRDHIRFIVPLIRSVLREAGEASSSIDGVAYTVGPGLVGALLVGSCIGRALAYSWQVQAIPIHHMEGHLLVVMLEDPRPSFPFLALLVSGGHTQLIKVEGVGRYHLLGETLDDAAGEALDKTAKLLGLGYPGGPKLEQLAALGVAGRFHFPRPMRDRPGLDFSFSGLKTAVAQEIRRSDGSARSYADIAYAFQEAVVDTLVIKCRRALSLTCMKRLVVAGGVSANGLLRSELTLLVKQIGGEIFLPRPQFCTDNGAMIAYAGSVRLKQQASGALIGDQDLSIQVYPRWPLADLLPPI